MIFETKEKYKEVFDEYYTPLCNFANKIVKRDDIAEDIVQEVFVKVWHKRDKIVLTSNIKNYLFQSTRNKAIEFLRKNKIETKYLDEKGHFDERVEEIEEEANNYLLKERLRRSIRQLPPKCQEIFVLSKMNGLTYNEIAEELNLSVKTVENQIGRGLKMLREMLNKMRTEDEHK